MKRILIAAALTLAVAIPASAGAADASPSTSSFIVVLRPGVADVPVAAAQLARSVRGEVGFVYQHALRGFSITASDAAAAALTRNPRVAFVERDEQVTLAAQGTPTGIDRILTDKSRIDIDGADDFRVGVDVAVIDTGVDLEHPDLNVVSGVNCATGNWRRSSCTIGGDDDHYHGTHVAGTIAALDNDFGVVGVAPGATIHPVKVLNSRGSGYTSWIVAGIDWVADNADTIEVANMSLGGRGFSSAEYTAIQGAVNAGVAFAVAAGNENDDAANYSPGGFDNVLSVSALADFDGASGGVGTPTCRSDVDDTLADFSNWGPEVDIAAPGVCITSTYPLEQGGYGTISGTSMASPHVAGALALLASIDNPDNATDVGNLYDAVTAAGNSDWTDDSGDGVREPLLEVSSFGAALVATGGGDGGGGGGDPTADTTAPTVSISAPAVDITVEQGTAVTFTGSATDDIDGDLTSSIVWTSDQSGGLGEGASVSVTLTVGTHVVTAEATDAATNTGSAQVTVTVKAAAPVGGVSLAVSAYKVRGVQYADLTWSGATTDVVVFRDGSKVGDAVSGGVYTDSTGSKGGGSALYKVCLADMSTCSADVAAVW